MSGFVPDPTTNKKPSSGGFVPDSPKPSTPNQPSPPNPLNNAIQKGQSVYSWMHGRQVNARRVLSGYEANVFNAWKDVLSAAGTGVAADLDILGTPGRIVQGVTQAVQKGPIKGTTPLQQVTDFSDRMNALNDLIWHPTPERVNSARKSVQRGLHIKTDDDIDTVMHSTLMSHVGQLRPYVANTLKTINNVATDTITDPFGWTEDAATAIRDLGYAHHLEDAPSASHIISNAAHHAAVNPATKPLIHAGVTASRMLTRHVYKLLQKHGAGPAFDHLAHTVANTKDSVSNTVSNLHDAFVVRPDLLHMGLTPAGRDVRVQLENGQRVLKHKDKIADESVINDGNASARRFQEYANQHGPQGSGALKDSDFKNENLPIPKKQVKSWEKKITQKMYPRGIKTETRENIKKINDKYRELHPKFAAAYRKQYPEVKSIKDIPKDVRIKWKQQIAAKMYPKGYNTIEANTKAVSDKLEKLRPQLEAEYRKSRPNKLDNIRAMDPEERREFFNYLRDNIHENELARKTKSVFGERGGKKLIDSGSRIEWDKYRAPKVEEVSKTAKVFADIGRAGIEINPLPHGGVNVPTLSFLGGGLDAVTRGVAAIAKPLDHVMESRLIQMGAGTPEYIGGHLGGIPGYAGVVNKMSGLLRKMEYGWRSGMLEHLDRALGPTQAGTKADYLKGALINKKLGDYRSLTAFARYFASFGGPYVAYKLGVLPTAVIDAVKNHPILFETVARTEGQLQDNREGSKRDKYAGSDPVAETGKAVTNPIGYVLDSALYGVMTDGARLANDWANPSETRETWDQGLSNIAGEHIAPLGLIQGAMQNIEGKSFSGQPMSFADHMAAVIIGALNQHIHKFPSDKTKRKNVKYIERHAFSEE